MKEEVISFAENKALPFCTIMCGISYCDFSYRILRENSSVNVIEYIISGRGTVEVDGNVFYPEAGDVYFLKRGENQRYYSDADTPWVKIWMNFSGKLADRITECCKLQKKYLFRMPDAKKYFFAIYKIANSGASANEVSEKCAVIFLKLAQLMAAAATENESNGLAEEARDYIDNMSNFSLKLDDIANALSYSKNHIIRSFKDAYGITPYEYMMNRRLEAAEALLKSTVCPVGEIAEKLNFCDSRYFSGVFRRKYGMTPREFRKKQRKI